METLTRRIQREIEEKFLVGPGEIVLVACSGGVDSMVLLDVMNRISGPVGFRVVAAHLDHGLRGLEGKKDQRLVCDFCRVNRIPFLGGEADVSQSAGRGGVSLQEAARKIRYAFLRESLDKIGGDKIATAHHADDQVETLLMRLLRGTGPRGLRGIPVLGEGVYVRPLLPVWKSDIRDYAEEMAVPYREDPGNMGLQYHRNRIRNVLIGELEEYNPRVKSALFRLSKWITEEGEVVDSIVDEALESVGFTRQGDEVIIDRDRLLEQPPYVIKEIIRRGVIDLGEDYGPGSAILERALRFVRCSVNGHRMDISGSLLLGRDFDGIYLQHRVGSNGFNFEGAVRLPIEPVWSSRLVLGRSTFRIEVDIINNARSRDLKGSPSRECFDLNGLEPPLYIHPWQEGDYLEPVGMKGRKKVSDILSERKIPSRVRSEVLILEDHRSVLWVVGVRRGRRAAVSVETETAVSISIERELSGEA
jgi:tRNA(Ile)-lysidine synthase